MTQPPITPNYQGMPQPQPGGGGGLAITSLVLGIIAIVTFCVPVLPWILGLLAIVLAVIAMGQAGANRPTGQAKAGLILGIVGLVLSVGFIIAARAGLSWAGHKAQQSAQSWQQQLEDAQKKAEAESKKALEQAQKQQEEYQREHPGATTQPTTP